MGIIFTSPLPCGPPQFHIAVAPCLAIVEVSYSRSELQDIPFRYSSSGRRYLDTLLMNDIYECDDNWNLHNPPT